MSKAKTPSCRGKKQQCWLGKSHQINEILQIILHKICASCEMFLHEMEGGPKLPFRKTTTLMYAKFSSKIIYVNSIIPAVYRLNDKHLYAKFSTKKPN